MKTDDSDLGYLAFDSPGPGLVIVHDVWGLYDHYRDLARRFAGEGFAALAVDLYRELGDVQIDDPGQWMRNLSDPQMLSRVQTAVDHLTGHEAVAGRVGVVGFCMGGSYALMAGCGVRGVAAVVPFYGILSHDHGLLHDPVGLDPAKKPRAPLEAAADLRCPMRAFFGGRDPYVPLDDVRALEQAVAQTGQVAEVEVYEAAGHAFMNDTRPQMYVADAAKDAWSKVVSFFKTHLSEGT